MLKPIVLITLGLLSSTTLVDAMQLPEEDRNHSQSFRGMLGVSQVSEAVEFSERIEDHHLNMWQGNPDDMNLLLCCQSPKALPTIHARVLACLPPLGSNDKKHLPLTLAYKQLIVGNESLHEEFCRLLLQGDPLNFHRLTFGMTCADESPNIRALLQTVVQETDFPSAGFVELSKDSSQIPLLQKHLMALNLLEMTIGPRSSPRLTELSDIQCKSIRQLLEKPTLAQGDIDHVLSQPLWPIFTGEFFHLSLSLFTKLMSIVPNDQLDLDRLTKLARLRWQLYLGLHRSSTETIPAGKPRYSSIQTFPECLSPFYDRLAEIYEEQNNHAKQVESLDDMLTMFGKGNPDESLRIADLYFDAGEYIKALEIIADTAEFTVDKETMPLLPFFIQRILIKAKTKKLPDVVDVAMQEFYEENWIESLKSEFIEDAESISIPLELTYSTSTGSYLGVRTETIQLCEVNDLEAAHALSNADFATAVKWLKQRFESEVYLRGIQDPFKGQPVLSRLRKQVADVREKGLLSLQSRPSIEECLYAALATQIENPDLPVVLVFYLRERLSQRLIPQGGKFIRHLEKHYAPALEHLVRDHKETKGKLEALLKSYKVGGLK